ncbi:hypothetical protein N9L68_04110, partial [bacterium]|nr:hypothetical protein [bacterium]
KVYGGDLHDENARRELLDDIRQWRPRLLVTKLQCRRWSQLQALHYSTSDLNRRRMIERLRAEERPFLELAEEIFQTQHASGCDAFAENLVNSAARKELPLR